MTEIGEGVIHNNALSTEYVVCKRQAPGNGSKVKIIQIFRRLDIILYFIG